MSQISKAVTSPSVSDPNNTYRYFSTRLVFACLAYVQGQHRTEIRKKKPDSKPITWMQSTSGTVDYVVCVFTSVGTFGWALAATEDTRVLSRYAPEARENDEFAELIRLLPISGRSASPFWLRCLMCVCFFG